MCVPPSTYRRPLPMPLPSAPAPRCEPRSAVGRTPMWAALQPPPRGRSANQYRRTATRDHRWGRLWADPRNGLALRPDPSWLTCVPAVHVPACGARRATPEPATTRSGPALTLTCSPLLLPLRWRDLDSRELLACEAAIGPHTCSYELWVGLEVARPAGDCRRPWRPLMTVVYWCAGILARLFVDVTVY
jgi:hypothetical protein